MAEVDLLAAFAFPAVLGVVAALFVTVRLVLSMRRGLDVALKPSFLFAAAFHVLVQWPAALRVAEVVEFLERPWEFLAVVHGFALILAVLSPMTFRAATRRVWSRLGARGEPGPPIGRTEVLVVAALLAGATAAYLAVVPFASTGLYAILFDPAASAQAREDSLKLLEAPLLAYVHLFAAKVLAPVLVCMLVLRPLPERGVVAALVLRGLLVVAAIGAATLSGARMFPVLVVLAATGAFLLKEPRRIRVPVLVGVAILGLFVLAAQSRLREGEPLTPESLVTYAFVNVLQNRLLGITLSNALFTADLVQTHGFLGPFGWARLADLYGVAATDLGRVVFQAYYPESRIQTGIANTSVVFVYYAYFGALATLVTAPLVLLLDVVVPVAARLSTPHAITLLVVVGVDSLSLIGSEFTTVLVTHGVLTGTVLVVALAYLFRHVRRADG